MAGTENVIITIFGELWGMITEKRGKAYNAGI